tara:strand:- start:904 stop:1500 length:597 start_codon:yes stop_codon:yes gene_type:complete
MSWIVAGIAIAGATVKTIGAGVNAYNANKTDTLGQAKNAEQIRSDEIALSRRTTDLSLKKNKTAFELAMESITNQVGDVSAQGTKSFVDIGKGQGDIIEKGGFAGSGQADEFLVDAKTDVRSAVDRSMSDLELKSKGASADYMNTIEGVNISREKDLAAINQRFTQRLGEIGSVADTGMEGIFGSDNSIKGYDYNKFT